MAHTQIGRPETGEYAAYYETYIGRVPEVDVLGVLEGQRDLTVALLREVSEDQAGFRYEPGKWSIKELVGHIVDTERVFAFRAFHFARGHEAPLPSFDQDIAAPKAGHERRLLSDIVKEFEAVRASTLHLFANLDREGWSSQGVANNNPVTVRALAYIIAGHERHHIEVLKERYL